MSVSPWIAKLDELAAAINASKLLLVEQDRQLNYGEFFTRVNHNHAYPLDSHIPTRNRFCVYRMDRCAMDIASAMPTCPFREGA